MEFKATKHFKIENVAINNGELLPKTEGQVIFIFIIFFLSFSVQIWQISLVYENIALTSLSAMDGSAVLYASQSHFLLKFLYLLIIAFCFSILVSTFIETLFFKLKLKSFKKLPIKYFLFGSVIFFGFCFFYREIGVVMSKDKIEYKATISGNLTVILISDIVSIEKTKSGYLVKKNTSEIFNIPLYLFHNETMFDKALGYFVVGPTEVVVK